MCALPQKYIVSSRLTAPADVFTMPLADSMARDRGACGRSEIVTIAVTKEDHMRLRLTAAGASYSNEISSALRYYLHAVKHGGYIQQIERSHGWARGPVISFKLPLPKDLVDEVRSLRGRFDGHTLEAVRLLMSGRPGSDDPAPKRAPSSTNRVGGLMSAALAALLLLMSRILGQPFFD
jgi:hypothetical protein